MNYSKLSEELENLVKYIDLNDLTNDRLKDLQATVDKERAKLFDFNCNIIAILNGRALEKK
jgi:hypothetical protein